MIGDKTSDIGAGLKSNLKTVLVKTGYGLKDMEKIDKNETLVCEKFKRFLWNIKKRKIKWNCYLKNFSKKSSNKECCNG